MEETRNSPQALQMLLPTSSRRQSGVVDVPQLAHERAPMGATRPLRPRAPWPALPSGESADWCCCSAAGWAEGEGWLLVFEESISEPVPSALLYVGQPEQDELPPVPLQRPSPGQVPPEGWEELGSWFCAEDSRAGEAAGVSSDGGVWVMCRLGSAAVPSSVAAGWVADVEEARVEPDRPRSGGRMLPFDLK